MSYLEHDLSPPGKVKQFIGFGNGRRKRLLHQQVRAAFEQIDGHLMMQDGRRGNHRGIDLADQGSMRIQGGRMQFGGKTVWPAGNGSTTPTI